MPLCLRKCKLGYYEFEGEDKEREEEEVFIIILNPADCEQSVDLAVVPLAYQNNKNKHEQVKTISLYVRFPISPRQTFRKA